MTDKNPEVTLENGVLLTNQTELPNGVYKNEVREDMNCETCGQQDLELAFPAPLYWCHRCGTMHRVVERTKAVVSYPPAIVKAARERLLHPEVDLIADQLSECCHK